MVSKKQKVVFYFPWREISGGPVYLTNLANDLSKDKNYDVYYIDYERGLSEDSLDLDAVKQITYTDENFIFPITDPVTFLVPICLPHRLPEMHPDSKIVFLNWHNCSIPLLKSSWEMPQNLLNDFLQLVYDTNSVFFLDCAHRLAQNTRDLKFPPRYVPTIIPKKDKVAKFELVDNNEINIGVLGRICGDKVYSIFNLLDNIEKLDETRKINVHIIGNGNFMGILKERVKGYFKSNVKFHGTLVKDKLEQLLINDIDILFAMGASILEGAAFKLPSVILPHNVRPFDGNNFVYLQNSKEYCLGWFDNQIDELDLDTNTLGEIITDVYDNNKKEELGIEAYNHYCKYHSCNIDKFKVAIQDSSLNFSVIQKLLASHYLLKKQYKICNVDALSIFRNSRKDVRIKVFNKIPFINIKVKNIFEKHVSFLGVPALKVKKGVTDTWNVTLLPIENARNFVLDYINKFNLKKDKRKELKSKLRQKLKKGQKIKVCLFVSRISCWMFKDLYILMKNSEIFDPIVVVDPYPTQGHDAMVNFMNETYIRLNARGFDPIKSYNEETGVYLDIKNEIDPDIVFYTKNWPEHFYEPYYITNFQDKLNYFVSYAMGVVDHPDLYDMPLNSMADKIFVPTQLHKQIAQQYSTNEGKNIAVTGSPKLDIFFDKIHKTGNAWKPQDRPKKRIIWAPHHSVDMPDDLYQYCAFEDLHEFMFEVAEKYKDEIQFAFKPHPILWAKLDYYWGYEKRCQYYQKWASLENGQLNDLEFTDLFLTSDAMILDSCSFISEYTATNKPMFFTIGEKSRVKWNSFGEENFKVIYKNSSNLKEEIIDFIDNVVIKGNDPLKNKRQKFIKKYLKPKNGKTASEHIYECVLRDCCVSDNG